MQDAGTLVTCAATVGIVVGTFYVVKANNVVANANVKLADYSKKTIDKMDDSVDEMKESNRLTGEMLTVTQDSVDAMRDSNRLIQSNLARTTHPSVAVEYKKNELFILNMGDYEIKLISWHVFYYVKKGQVIDIKKVSHGKSVIPAGVPVWLGLDPKHKEEIETIKPGPFLVRCVIATQPDGEEQERTTILKYDRENKRWLPTLLDTQ